MLFLLRWSNWVTLAMGVRWRRPQHWRFFSWKSSSVTTPLRLRQSSTETFGRTYVFGVMSGRPTSSCRRLLNSPTLPTTLPLMASVSTGLRLYSSLSRVNKHYFFTSMTMRLWITVSASSTWRLVSTRKWYHTGPLVGVQGNLEAPIRSDVPTSAVVRRWVHMAKKSTWRGMHVCSVFGYLAHHQVEIRK